MRRRLAWTPRRRALVAGSLLAVFALALMGLGGAAWCDASRFGYFVQVQPAPDEVPSVDFTAADAEAYPDVHAALLHVGMPVRAEFPEGARAYLDRLAAEGVAAVRAEVAVGSRVSTAKFYVAGYEQTPSETWTAVCG